MGWKNKNKTRNSPEYEAWRHGEASKGHKTTYANAHQSLSHPKKVQKYKRYNKKSGKDEWIADIDYSHGTVRVTDYQKGDKAESYLNFNGNDTKELSGYIHRHPKGVLPEFSSEDFLLSVKILKLRSPENLKRTKGWTYLGLVTPKKVEILRIKPKKKTQEEIIQLAQSSSDTFDHHMETMKLKRKLIKSGEIIVVSRVKINQAS